MVANRRGVDVNVRACVLVLAAGAVAAPAGMLASCGNGSASPSPTIDAATTSFTYAPRGCAYSVSPPEVRAFTDFALDDPASSGAEPLRVRAGLGGGTTVSAPGYADPTTSVAFTWQTATKVSAARVRMGTDPNALGDVHAGYSWTTPPPTVGLGANEPGSFMHEVHVCGLSPGATYYYQVGGGDTWSATQSIRTVPASGKITLGIFGDARDKVTTWQLVHQRMRDAAVAMQLVSGDIVDIGTLETQYETWLDAIWKDPADPSKFLTLGQQIMVPIAGNHENEAARFYANFAIPGDGAYAEQYASFDVGNTHFALVDDEPISEDATSAASVAILSWLDQDLARADADRQSHPFVVVVSHRGIFSTSHHARDADVLAVRAALAPLFDKHRVDLALNGHEHEFERSKALLAGPDPAGPPIIVSSDGGSGLADASGTMYVINAGAGADPYAVATSAADYREKASPFGPGTSYIGCYGLMTLENTTLTLKSYGLRAAGPDDELDSLVMTK